MLGRKFTTALAALLASASFGVETELKIDKATVLLGRVKAGQVGALGILDGAVIQFAQFFVPNQASPRIIVRFEATCPFQPTSMWLDTVSRCTVNSLLKTTLSLMNWQTGEYDPTTEVSDRLYSDYRHLTLNVADPTAYVRPADRRVWVRMAINVQGPSANANWYTDHDLFLWHLESAGR